MRAETSDRHIVLLGIGHTNAHVLRMWGKRPIENARLTCISDFETTAYSGMLPGTLAGQYEPEQMKIDLIRLCESANARLIVDQATGLDLDQKQLQLSSNPPCRFDVLAIGVGSTSLPDEPNLKSDALVPIKPMQTFLSRLAKRLQNDRTERTSQGVRIVVVGGGAGGVEIAFCVPNYVQQALGDTPFELSIVHNDTSLAAGTVERTNRLALKELEKRGVELLLGRNVLSVEDDMAKLDDGREIPADVVIWAAGADPHPLLAELGLPTDDEGFLLTHNTLRTVGDAPVFAVGDCGTIVNAETPKAGVYAVKQGPVLWENIQRLLAGRSLKTYEPQKNFLRILNTGDGRAIAEYMGFAAHGRWAWRLKDWIDGRFIAKYRVDSPLKRAE